MLASLYLISAAIQLSKSKYSITPNVDASVLRSQVIVQLIRFITETRVNVDVNIPPNHPSHVLAGTDGVVQNVLVCVINLQSSAQLERYVILSFSRSLHQHSRGFTYLLL